MHASTAPLPFARPLLRLVLLSAWKRWKHTEAPRQPRRSPVSHPQPQQTSQPRHSVSRHHDYDDKAPSSLSTSTPAVPDVLAAKHLPVELPAAAATGAAGGGETGAANRSGSSDGDFVSSTNDRRVGSAEMLFVRRTLSEASVDNASGGEQTAGPQGRSRRGSAAERGTESSAPASKEAGCVETPVTANEKCEHDEENRGVTGICVARGRELEEGLSTAGDKEILWQQRQALLRK